MGTKPGKKPVEVPHDDNGFLIFVGLLSAAGTQPVHVRYSASIHGAHASCRTSPSYCPRLVTRLASG